MRSKMNNLKLFALFVSILLLTLRVTAQESNGISSSSKLWIGIKGGGSQSGFSSDSRLGSNWGYGFQIGPSVSYTLFDWLRVSFEPVYARFNTTVPPSTLYYPNQEIIDRISKSEVNLDCADLPLIVNLSLPTWGKKLKPVLSIGATSGIYFNAVAINTWNNNVGSTPVIAKVADNVTERYRYYDFAGIGGVGLEFGNISFGLYYRLHLRNLNTVHYSTYKDYGINSIQANIGLRFY
jgi:hypothetical protein